MSNEPRRGGRSKEQRIEGGPGKMDKRKIDKRRVYRREKEEKKETRPFP